MAFNRLTNKEAELLDMLAEEAAEVIQAVMKIKRHGLTSHHPKDDTATNNMLLSYELGDLIGVMAACSENRLILDNLVQANAMTKMKRSAPYLHHQDDGAGSDYRNGTNRQ
jgi:NTP pyrophosphatase (non-canonical NTP hydrolase)